MTWSAGARYLETPRNQRKWRASCCHSSVGLDALLPTSPARNQMVGISLNFRRRGVPVASSSFHRRQMRAPTRFQETGGGEYLPACLLSCPLFACALPTVRLRPLRRFASALRRFASAALSQACGPHAQPHSPQSACPCRTCSASIPWRIRSTPCVRGRICGMSGLACTGDGDRSCSSG